MEHKAFVSSTFIDLEKHRSYVIDALRKAGFFVDPMEDWVASNDEPKIFSQRRIEGCNLCVLLVGFRRGFIPDNESQSITQLEYQAAKSNGINILVFLLDEKAPWPRDYDDFDSDPEVKIWRQQLQKEYGVGFFGLDPSSIPIAPALTRWMATQNNPQPKQYDYKYILSLQPELMDLAYECETADTGKPLKILRKMIINRLEDIASKNGIESKGKPPAELLGTLSENQLINLETQKCLEFAIGVTSETLYDETVIGEEAIKAIQETAVGFNYLNSEYLDLPHFKVVTTANGKSKFEFLVDKHVLVSSDGFFNQRNALNGIRSARRAVKNRGIKKLTAKNGSHLFSILGANGQLFGHSILFTENTDMDIAIDSVKKHLPLAPILDSS